MERSYGYISSALCVHETLIGKQLGKKGMQDRMCQYERAHCAEV